MCIRDSLRVRSSKNVVEPSPNRQLLSEICKHRYGAHEARVSVVCVHWVCLRLVFHEKHVFEVSYSVLGLSVPENYGVWLHASVMWTLTKCNDFCQNSQGVCVLFPKVYANWVSVRVACCVCFHENTFLRPVCVTVLGLGQQCTAESDSTTPWLSRRIQNITIS